jgi:hypothetical protein
MDNSETLTILGTQETERTMIDITLHRKPSATMFGLLIFTPVYFIPRFCFICFFLIISFCSFYDSLSK